MNHRSVRVFLKGAPTFLSLLCLGVACSGTIGTSSDDLGQASPVNSAASQEAVFTATGNAPASGAGEGAAVGGTAGGAGGISLTGGAGGTSLPGETLTPGVPPLPQWSASVGSWCGPEDKKTIWLVANPDASACDLRASNIYGDGTLDGFSVELPEEQLGAMPTVLDVPVRHCEGGICETLEASFSLSAYSAEQGLSGEWELTLPDGVVTQGKLQADWCAWDEDLPAHPEGNRLVAGLQMKEIAIYQAVKVPLMRDFETPNERNAPVVIGRPALVRVFAEPQETFEPHEVRAKLTIQNGAEDPLVFEQLRVVDADSRDDDLDSTFNFEVPADAFSPESQYSVELLETVPCGESDLAVTGARFPEADSELATLDALEVGGIKIELLPVRYDGDGSGRLPDTSEEQLELFRTGLMQKFPISNLTLTVREEPLATNVSDLGDLLDQVRDLRARENPPRDLNYYGLIRSAETFREYCQGSCTTGIAGVPSRLTGGSGTGIGYSGETSAGTFVHEIGHILGRPHSPCNVGGDRNYPYEGGQIGSWGYDVFEKEFYAPDEFSDFMGYCNSVWISDYVYDSLAGFIAGLNEQTSAASYFGAPQNWRTVILNGDNEPRWGLTTQYYGAPDGDPETVSIYGPLGNLIDQVTAYRTSAPDSELSYFTVPEATTSNWWAVGVAGAAPLPFAESAGFEPFH